MIQHAQMDSVLGSDRKRLEVRTRDRDQFDLGFGRMSKLEQLCAETVAGAGREGEIATFDQS